MRFLLLAVALLVALSGCHRKADPPGSAPTNVTATPGDGVVLMNWDTLPDLTYWIFFRAGDSVSAAQTGATAIRRAFAPRVVFGLANDQDYAFVMNATHNDSEAGPSSPVLVARPRLAGDTWSPSAIPTSANPTSANLNGIAFSGGRFVTVGDATTIFAADAFYGSTNPPGVAEWVPALSIPAGFAADLVSVIFNGSFVALASDGRIISSADGLNWGANITAPVAGAKSIAFGVVAGIAPTYVVVGDGGQIVTGNLVNPWTQQTSNTANNLNYVTSLNGGFFATGANGTLLASPDGGITWIPQATGTTATLRGIAFSLFTPSVRFAAVGDGGSVVTTPNTDPANMTWSAAVIAGAPNLRAITTGGSTAARFLAVGLGGAVVHSDDGLAWAPAVTPPASDLSSVLFGSAFYMAVGAAGANAVSK